MCTNLAREIAWRQVIVRNLQGKWMSFTSHVTIVVFTELKRVSDLFSEVEMGVEQSEVKGSPEEHGAKSNEVSANCGYVFARLLFTLSSNLIFEAFLVKSLFVRSSIPKQTNYLTLTLSLFRCQFSLVVLPHSHFFEDRCLRLIVQASFSLAQQKYRFFRHGEMLLFPSWRRIQVADKYGHTTVIAGPRDHIT